MHYAMQLKQQKEKEWVKIYYSRISLKTTAHYIRIQKLKS